MYSDFQYYEYATFFMSDIFATVHKIVNIYKYFASRDHYISTIARSTLFILFNNPST